MTVLGVPPDFGIFICYRRDDTGGYADNIYDKLAAHFDESHVFIDIDKIPAGDDFTKVLARALSDCDVLLVLIGTAWLPRRGWRRRNRLADPEDYVRLEIAMAIHLRMRIIPVLIRGGKMPDRKALPPDLAKLPDLQAFELSGQHWLSGMPSLIRRIEECGAAGRHRTPDHDDATALHQPPDNRRPRATVAASVVAAAVLALAVVLVLALRPNGGSTGQPPAPPSASPPTSIPVTGGPATPSTPGGDVAFADDFSGTALDPDRWDAPSNTEHFRLQGGWLVLSTRPGQGVDYTTVEPTALRAPFTDVRFSVTIPPYHHAGQGGGALVLNPRGPQPQLLTMGPGAKGGVLVAPLVCARATCNLSRYEDFQQPDYDLIPDQQPDQVFAVHLTYADGRLTYLLNGQVVGSTSVDPGPLTELWFSVSSGPGESWDVRIDDLVVR